MKTCIILYASQHHNNTEKLVMAVSKAIPGITTVSLLAEPMPDISGYDLVGLASGIYMGKPHPAMLNFLEERKDSLEGRDVLTILTSGSNAKKYEDAFHGKLKKCGSTVSGGFQCKGFDTYGLFRWIGGLAKGHPNQKDMEQAISAVKKVWGESSLLPPL